VAEQKIRCEEPRFDAGGGGINVSKAIFRLEVSSLFYGWRSNGEIMKDLLTTEGIELILYQ
jgi:6-phosphofructokinase 2